MGGKPNVSHTDRHIKTTPTTQSTHRELTELNKDHTADTGHQDDINYQISENYFQTYLPVVGTTVVCPLPEINLDRNVEKHKHVIHC